ncbi:hypothetical protein LCGC14_0095490 [marine sediment metagenome]|uniref:Beta-galactosidase n=1 Tax=marine sediment metagenome TaxID=412755 RepID=A0A0F9XW57_9ZZZZ|nr:beta-galactosidase [Phycisphaerae bacterium]HDZ45120.1 beta-galactosidase [Phycisphaerae bacterium]
MTIPRPEYPRPQFVREDWLCLNGPWQFEIDQADSGIDRGLLDRELEREIVVPFPPESEASGIGCCDLMEAVWYRRDVDIPADWAGRKVLLHFQAVGTDATVWVNGQEVVRHRGCWTGFVADLAGVAGPGERAIIALRARFDTRTTGPHGKQHNASPTSIASHDCCRSTGIWQTVWLEPVNELHLNRPRITPDVANRKFRITQPVSQNRKGSTIRATLLWEGKELSSAEVAADADLSPSLDLVVPEDQLHLWDVGEGNLYDITLELLDADGTVVDRADAYAGLRSVTIDGMKVLINGRSVFQRLVLDQGQYLDTRLTAPSDEALLKDLEITLAAGFNGSRFHEKVFEERSLYHADRLGLLVWGEFGDWGWNLQDPNIEMTTQWLEELERDYNHPCIIGWCGLNETVEEISDEIRPIDDITRAMFLAAKAMDSSRIVLDSSGHAHRAAATDVWDSHDYDFASKPDEWAAHHDQLAEGQPHVNAPSWLSKPINGPYGGQPYFCSEIGGVWWAPRNKELGRSESWGYGERPETLERYLELFKFYCDRFLDHPLIFGYCWTQLTDTGSEQNGVVYQDRTDKLDLDLLREIQSRQAAIESGRE